MISALTNETIIVRSRHVDFVALDDDFVAIDGELGFAFSVNPTALRIWELVEQPIVFDALVDLLADEFDIDDGACRADAAGFITELTEAGLVRLE